MQEIIPVHKKLAVVSIIMLLILIGGKNHRVPFQEQFVNWHDGLFEYSYPTGYPEIRNAWDSFNPGYYSRFRNTQNIVNYLNEQNLTYEEDKMRLVHRIISKRFIHYMYPTYSWLQSPLFNALEVGAPHKSFNQIYLTNDLLKYSAAAACGHVSTVFVDTYRDIGGKAQFVSLNGMHSIAEAEAEGKRFVIDCDYEIIIPHSVNELANDPELAYSYYAKKCGEQLGAELRDIYKNHSPIAYGYENPPTSSPRTYALHAFYFKIEHWIPFLLLAASYIRLKKA